MAGARDRKLEFVVVAAVLGVLAHFLLGALDETRREVEEATAQAEVAALRVELLDRLAHREGFGGTLPASDNPVVWTGRAPASYAGEVDTADAAAGRGVWFYARGERALVYRFRAGDEWRFRIERRAGGVADGAVLGGVGLARVGPGDAGVERK
ncbi:MAG: hypothetical protein H3C26_12730 [Rhodocyclaceae bacterium]|nr:hypothetical protein [Rhodocyclaceae bacterium]